MLIRSQNKMIIANIDNLDSISANTTPDDKVNIYTLNGGEESCSHIGVYSSEEKAIKVLDMICDQYAYFSCRYGSDHSDDAVFQMPQDSEV